MIKQDEAGGHLVKTKKPIANKLLERTPDIVDNWSDDEYPDAQGIGYFPLGNAGVVGYVDSVNGAASEACWEFNATKHEMKTIAKHWYRELTKIDLFWFQHQTSGSIEWRTAIYARRRLNRLRNHIGDMVDEAIAEVDSEFQEILGHELFEQFQNQR